MPRLALLAWLGQLRRVRGTGPLSERSKAQILAALSSVFAYAVDIDRIHITPVGT
jgi:hypothetical protein